MQVKVTSFLKMNTKELNRTESTEDLLEDLEEEQRAKVEVDVENAELEKKAKELEVYLNQLDVLAIAGSAEENEWKMRYELGKKHGLHLADVKAWLESELEDAKWQLETGSYPEVIKCDLDTMSNLELIQLVRHLEKIRNDYFAGVSTAEGKAEHENREFQRIDGIRRELMTELRQDFEGMERIHMNDMVGLQTKTALPMTPSSITYLQWLDSQPKDIKSINTSLLSKKGTNKEVDEQVEKLQRQRQFQYPAFSDKRQSNPLRTSPVPM